MAYLKELELETIKKFVDSKYYDVKKLISYLSEHDKVGNEIFSFVYKGGWNKRENTPYSPNLDRYGGYYSLSVQSFIRKIPFFFYHYEEDATEDFGSLDDVFEDYQSPLIYWKEEEIKEMYHDLEYMFYEKSIPLKDMFNYCRRQVGHAGGGYFRNWVKYIRKCDNLGINDYMPECFITAYNMIIEEENKKQKKEQEKEHIIVYGINPDGDIEKKYERNHLEIIFKGVFPHDCKGNPIMKYINLDVRNASKIWCEMEKSREGKLHVLISPTTTIDLLYYDSIADEMRKVKRIYTGPQKMKFNKDALKRARKQSGLTQKEVAEAIAANERTYQKWEGGETTPDGYYLLKLINWLNISDPLSLIIEEE